MTRFVACKLAGNVFLFALLLSAGGPLLRPIPRALAESPAESGLKGLAPEAIKERFGDPDKTSRAGKDGEAWFYGRSMILFSEGKVSAWSNAGELQGRQNVAAIRAPENEREKTTPWHNAWTPMEPVDEQEVLRELLSSDAENAAPAK